MKVRYVCEEFELNGQVPRCEDRGGNSAADDGIEGFLFVGWHGFVSERVVIWMFGLKKGLGCKAG